MRQQEKKFKNEMCQRKSLERLTARLTQINNLNCITLGALLNGLINIKHHEEYYN
jgi:hypothetical protein